MPPISMNLAVPVPLAEIPRVFLNATIPGVLGANGRIHLPISMDGSLKDTGVPSQRPEELAAWATSHEELFASKRLDFRIFATEEAYRNEVQPPWLRDAVRSADGTVRSYAGSIPPKSHLRPAADGLLQRWPQIHALLSGALYMTSPQSLDPHAFYINTQDLALFGRPLRHDGPVYAFLCLLDAFAHVEGLLASGMGDRIRIKDGEAVREIYDACDNLNPGRIDHRPLYVLETDARGEIDLFGAEPVVPHTYLAFQSRLTDENGIFAGFYLFAHYRFTETEMARLKEIGSSESRAAAPLFPDTTIDRILGYLKETGRSLGFQERFQAELMIQALDRIHDLD